MRNLHSWGLRSRDPAYPALPYRRIRTDRRGRVGGESRECHAKGRLFSCRVDTMRILGKGDTHIHVEAWWADRTRSHQSTSARSNHRAASAFAAGLISVIAISLRQHTRLRRTHSHAAMCALYPSFWNTAEEIKTNTDGALLSAATARR